MKIYRVQCLYPNGQPGPVHFIRTSSTQMVDYIMTDITDKRQWPWGWMTEEVKMPAKKKPIYMFKVVCFGCARIRLWDDENDFQAETCPECASTDLTVSEVEVTE